MPLQDDQPVQLRGALFGLNREDVSNLQARLERTKHELADRVELAGRELARAEDSAQVAAEHRPIACQGAMDLVPCPAGWKST
jgi:hypothetical protein